MKNRTEQKFVLAKTLHENGVDTKKIADILDRKPHTIQIWFQYPTYKEYCEATAIRLEKYKEKKVSVKVNETIDISFNTEVIKRLDRIEQMLSAKKVIW
jgi:hypothetical protein